MRNDNIVGFSTLQLYMPHAYAINASKKNSMTKQKIMSGRQQYELA